MIKTAAQHSYPDLTLFYTEKQLPDLPFLWPWEIWVRDYSAHASRFLEHFFDVHCPGSTARLRRETS